MATINNLLVNKKAQTALVKLVKDMLEHNNKFTEMRTKMEVIDVAYARYKAPKAEAESSGVDEPGKQCCDAYNTDNVTPPIVVSQVDSYTAYLADVFLSGYPLFPVVSPPNKRTNAEKLEVLMDDHAKLGGYVRQLLLTIRNGIKYNVCATEVAWSSIEQYSVESSALDKTGQKTKKAPKYYNAIKSLDMYNTFWDRSVAPGDVACEGDYAGYIELISKPKLKKQLIKLATEEKAMNIKEAMESSYGGSVPNSVGAGESINYHNPPVISQYLSTAKGKFNWATYFGLKSHVEGQNKANLYDGSMYEKVTVYARIVPSDYGISAPSPNTPQIWKLIVINSKVLVCAERIVSAYDYLPILFGQPLEDGLDYQTQSVAEAAIPFQEAADTLYNIRFAASRRAVSDRALYNAEMIDPSDVNNPAPAAKIPVRFKSITNMGFEQAYKALPFDMRGTETTLQDASIITSFAQELSGLNGPQRGQFQKGNKSVQEWNDTLAGSDNRLRLPALLLEAQVFGPMKDIMVLNIFQYGEDVELVSQRSGETITINIAELRSQVLSFRIADGYTPKAKMASVEMLTAGMNMIMNSPLLQQAYGQNLPNMFAHIMQLGGVRDLDLYNPQASQQAAPAALANQVLQQNGIPAGTDLTTGAPAMSDPSGSVQV